MKIQERLYCIVLCSLFLMSGCTTSQDTQTNTNTKQQPTSKQEQSKNQEMTQEQAIELALANANATKEATSAFKAKRDIEHGAAIYEIEFIYKDVAYSYEIRASDGMILKQEQEEHHQNQPSTQDTAITLEQAQQLVLEKVAGASIHDLSIKRDVEDGIPTYEGELYYQGMEYEFEINANNGAFLKWKEEVWD